MKTFNKEEIKKIVGNKTLVGEDRLMILHKLVFHTSKLEGEYYECGVYKGGSAALIVETMKENNIEADLHLFDTFIGMPVTDTKETIYKEGVFGNTSLELVREVVNNAANVKFYKGFIPDTFKGCENHKIVYAHIDLDIYRSYVDALNFIYPRLVSGGVMVFDDYNFPCCKGAKKAVQEFFIDKPELVLELPTRQGVVFKI